MREREKLNKYRFFIKRLIHINKIWGKRGNKLLLKVFADFPGKIGILLRYIFICNSAKDCGWNVYIAPNVVIKEVEHLKLGNNVSIHRWCYIDAEGEIDIGDDVSIAHMTSILSANHRYDKKNIAIKDQGLILKKITIKNNVWIGAKSIILAGMTIGSGSIVAAGGVVTKNVENSSIVAGIPASIIKER